jgi:calcium-dependent protein kinase
VSPEVLAGSYNAKCDIWSIGVIAYMLLSGVPPFYGADDKATLQAVRQGKWKFHSTLFKSVSQAGKNFVTNCLDKHLNTRPSAAVAMGHEWFYMLKNKEDANADGISVDIIERIRGFETRSTLSKVCMEVISHNLALDQIEHLQEEFMKIDSNKVGEISYADMRKVLMMHVGYGELTETEIERIFTGINFDQTGVIQYHEFLAATISRKAITEENMHIAFERISKSRDFVTGLDLCEIMGLDVSSEYVAGMMSEIQQLPDNKIDFKQVRIRV